MAVPFRQVHVDFHTSPAIPDVAADFDPTTFARTLKEAHVNSATVFARCHHGMTYYPSRVTPAHPNLRRPDLLGEMIEALHAHDIRCPIYLPVAWDEHAAMTHQEWLAVARDGRLVGRAPLDVEGRWRSLCLNTGYAELVVAQTEEILGRYPVDGLFFDITRQPSPGCVCDTCLAAMVREGIDPEDDAELTRYSLEIARGLMERLSRLVRERRPQATIFYNSRTRIESSPELGMRDELRHVTHVEIESLPSGHWGYDHFPLFARYFSGLGQEMLGMTSRFHRAWGDFGGVRTQAALDYECFGMLALGAKCSIGDQLHPRGALERAVYRRIGATYASVAEKEPWCSGASLLADIGVLFTTSRTSLGAVGRATDEDTGASRALLELHQQFELIDREADFSRYAVLVLPDTVAVDGPLADKLERYLEQGGTLLLSGRSGLRPAGDAFALDAVGLDYLGPGEYDPDYIACGPPISAGIPELPVVQYGGSQRVAPRPGTEVLAEIVAPYFQRSWRHFSSHAQTPYDRPAGRPAVTRRGNVVYIANPVFGAYSAQAYPVQRDIVGNCLRLLLPTPLVETSLPSGGQATVLRQTEPERLVVHLLYYVWQRRAPGLDVVEDVVPLRDVRLAVRTRRAPTRVYLAPQRQELPFSRRSEPDVVTVTVPTIAGHQIVVLE
jgi:Hypothetical glycosyl hydrolase 6/Beta-galactosidase trimerisation domain